MFHLEELAATDGGVKEHLDLCSACLGSREIAHWPAASREAKRMRSALGKHREVYGARFTFLGDGQRIHLLRLRPTWVHQHAYGPTASGIHHRHG